MSDSEHDTQYVTGVTGDASIGVQAPQITTPEEASAYCAELRRAAQDLEYQAKLDDSTSRKFLMLRGRATSAVEMLHRTGMLSSAAFVRHHADVTGLQATPEQVRSMDKIGGIDDARAYLSLALYQLQTVRQQVDDERETAAQKRAFRRFLLRLGHFLEALGILLRQRLIVSESYVRLFESAMSTLLPTLTDAHGARLTDT